MLVFVIKATQHGKTCLLHLQNKKLIYKRAQEKSIPKTWVCDWTRHKVNVTSHM